MFFLLKNTVPAILISLIVAFPAVAKKIYIIDSYHAGYAWSDDLIGGVEKVLKGGNDEYKIGRMDTKRNPAEEFKTTAAQKIKAEIDAYQPDIIIAADDNASKYVIVPFYKNGKIPVVFCGLNWDASAYGFPCSNVTGMIEVAPFPTVQNNIKAFAKGNKIGFISVDNETARKEAENWENVFKITMEKKFCKTFAEWKDGWKSLQAGADWVFFDNNAGIQGWDSVAAETFVYENTTKPTASIYDWISNLTLLTIAKDPGEQGEWAALAVQKVLGGTAISAIPVDRNKRGIVILNKKMADMLGVTFDLNLVKQAKTILK